MSAAWSEDRVELLKKLWAEGLSASQIARTMGDVTRNAVIGQVHRRGLSARATTSRKERQKTAKVPKPQPKPVVAVREHISVKEATLSDGGFATVMTITLIMCRWPIGDPGASDFHFCGNQTEAGDPYCTTHANLAYQPSINNRNRVGTSQGSKEMVEEMMQEELV